MIFSRNLSNLESSEKKGFGLPMKEREASEIIKKSTISHNTDNLYSKIYVSL